MILEEVKAKASEKILKGFYNTKAKALSIHLILISFWLVVKSAVACI
jgi:hypothetical protein